MTRLFILELLEHCDNVWIQIVPFFMPPSGQVEYLPVATCVEEDSNYISVTQEMIIIDLHMEITLQMIMMVR